MASEQNKPGKVQTPAAIAEERFERRHEGLLAACRTLNLEEQMAHFISSVTMNKNEMNLREKVMEDLSNALRGHYPLVRLHPFGSLISGLGDKDSDLDVFVDSVGDAMNGGRSIDREQKSGIFQDVLRIVRGGRYRKNHLFSDVVPIAYARIPIIKFVHRPTKIHCDVSFENILSVRNSQLIQFLIELDPRVRPLMCVLRYWGKFNKLTDSTKIKNYGLILLVVFLERRGILPSVYKLQHWETRSPEFRVDYWNAAFYTNKKEILKFLDSQGRPPVELNEKGQPTSISILQLAMGFFQLYANFKPDIDVVCTLTGKFIHRDLFAERSEHELPEELNDYKIFSVEAPPETRRLDTSPQMSFIIQDPFALNFNVSAVTRENTLIHFLKACEATVSHLSHFLKSAHGGAHQNMMDIFSSVEFVDHSAQKRKENRILNQQQEVVNYLTHLKGVEKGQTNFPPSETSSFSKHVVDFVDAQLALRARTSGRATYEETATSYDPATAVMSKRLLVPLHETEFTLSPPPAYKDLFSARFSKVPGMQVSEVRRKGKILYFLFMQDMFKCFFSKCFGIDVEIEVKEGPPEEKSGGVPATETSENNNNGEVRSQVDSALVLRSPEEIAHGYPNPFWALAPLPKSYKRQHMESTSTSGSEGPSTKSQVLNPDRSLPPQAKYLKASGSGDSESHRSTEEPLPASPLREKLLSISDDVYKPLLLVLRCEGKYTVWEGRKVTLKAIRREAWLKPTQNKPIDPMDIEEEITKRFQGNPAPFRFDCEVNFQPSIKFLSIHVGVKEVLFPLRKPSRTLAAMNSMLTTLHEIHEKYIMFRLAKWLEDLPPPGVQGRVQPTVFQHPPPPRTLPNTRSTLGQGIPILPMTPGIYQVLPSAYEKF